MSLLYMQSLGEQGKQKYEPLGIGIDGNERSVWFDRSAEMSRSLAELSYEPPHFLGYF